MGQLFSRQDRPPAEGGPDNPETTWWCRLLARIVGAVGAVIAIILGVVCFINIIHPRCIGAGIIQIAVAFIVLVFEAPVCCQFVDITKPIGAFAEKRTYFQKALIYGILSIVPIAICFGLSTLFGSGLIFATGVIYGLMALGKKADRSQMQAQAQAESGSVKPADDNTNLIASDSVGADQGNPFNQRPAGQFTDQNKNPGSVQQAAGQYAGQFAGQHANQYVQSQFSN